MVWFPKMPQGADGNAYNPAHDDDSANSFQSDCSPVSQP